MGKRRVLTATGPRGGLQTTHLVLPREFLSGRERLFYCEGGLGSPLVLIHGLGGSSRWWFRLFPALTAANLRLIAPDLPGFGRSAGLLNQFSSVARAVIELLDHLELGSFYLCGHSMGGAIATEIAAAYPSRVRRLVLIDSAGIPGVGARQVLARLGQPWSWCPPGFYPTLLTDFMRAGPRSIFRAIRQMRRLDIRPSLGKIQAPTLVIWGARDALTPAEHGQRIVAALPNGQLEVVSEARHIPMVSDPEATARLMIGFLSGVSSRGEADLRSTLEP